MPRTRTSARADARGALVLVLGNEAGDLDSAASAIALCYAIEHEYAHFARYGLPRARYVPVLQTRRSDLDQRRENLAVYAAVGIDAADLLCIEEVRAATDGALTPANNTFVGLVDHAALVPSWGSAAVLIVFFHHPADHRDIHLSLRRQRQMCISDSSHVSNST